MFFFNSGPNALISAVAANFEDTFIVAMTKGKVTFQKKFYVWSAFIQPDGLILC